PVRSKSDFEVAVAFDGSALETADTVVIPPCEVKPFLDGQLPQEISSALARICPGARVVSICTGAFVLAAAGLLDDRPAATHWNLVDIFRTAFPRVRVDPDALYVDDGALLTSAGASAGIDLCLYLIRADHGSEVAN